MLMMSQYRQIVLVTLLLIIVTCRSQTIDLTIDECTTVETRLTVVNGYTGGTVYIEGTTQNFTECHKTLAGDATDVFQLTFETCGVNYGFLASSNTIDFYVVVTEYPFANIFSDPRFHVRCSFQESTNNVDIQIESVTADKSGTEKKYDTDPSAEISLCTSINGSCEPVSYSDIVTMGDELTLRFELSPQVPNYELRVDECFFEAKDQQNGVTASSLQLLDVVTHCSQYAIFPDFVHSTMTVTSSGGNVFDVPYATTSFTAFIPLTVTKALALVDLDLVIGCKVALCFSGSNDCSVPTCSSKRKRRESDSNGLEQNNTQIWLYEGFKMQLVDHENTQTEVRTPNDAIRPTTEPGINHVCLNRDEFWAVLLSLLLLITCAIIGFCCCFVKARRQQRERKVLYDNISSSPPVSKSRSVSSLSQSHEQQPHMLPRFVAYSLTTSQNHI